MTYEIEEEPRTKEGRGKGGVIGALLVVFLLIAVAWYWQGMGGDDGEGKDEDSYGPDIKDEEEVNRIRYFDTDTEERTIIKGHSREISLPDVMTPTGKVYMIHRYVEDWATDYTLVRWMFPRQLNITDGKTTLEILDNMSSTQATLIDENTVLYEGLYPKYGIDLRWQISDGGSFRFVFIINKDMTEVFEKYDEEVILSFNCTLMHLELQRICYENRYIYPIGEKTKTIHELHIVEEEMGRLYYLSPTKLWNTTGRYPWQVAKKLTMVESGVWNFEILIPSTYFQNGPLPIYIGPQWKSDIIND